MKKLFLDYLHTPRVGARRVARSADENECIRTGRASAQSAAALTVARTHVRCGDCGHATLSSVMRLGLISPCISLPQGRA